MPAERAIEAPQASLEIQRIAAAHCVSPRGQRARLVLRVRSLAGQERPLLGAERGT